MGNLKSPKALSRFGQRNTLDGTFKNQQATLANSLLIGSLKGSYSYFRLLVIGFGIPSNLVVNADQTAIHLHPLGNERTYAQEVLVM